jgi:hypothetical protein
MIGSSRAQRIMRQSDCWPTLYRETRLALDDSGAALSQLAAIQSPSAPAERACDRNRPSERESLGALPAESPAVSARNGARTRYDLKLWMAT